jgi:hypothetical protein
MSEQQQPQFPLTNINITPQGMLVSIMLTPTLSFNQLLDENVMNEVVKKWMETRREVKRDLALIHDINRTKNNN